MPHDMGMKKSKMSKKDYGRMTRMEKAMKGGKKGSGKKRGK